MEWAATVSLVFGGCCSNAVTLEQLTSSYPHSGTLITFLQFLLVSLHGLPHNVFWTPYGPRFRPRRIPLGPYVAQVALFYLISLLNNAAFGYRIPMSVHIIFRSGGLIISMLLGWLITGKKYTLTQILSVLLVTLGVILTTLSPSQTSSSIANEDSIRAYLTGIAILTLALVFSGLLGLAQDYTYSRYGRPSLSEKSAHGNNSWQESMFYLHFLALPMFYFVRQDLGNQLAAVASSPKTSLRIILPSNFSTNFLGNIAKGHSMTIQFPSAYLPLALNTITQLVCVAGVHRLTTSVTSLTVTLVLVVRKAVSLIISVLAGFGANAGHVQHVDLVKMWVGATMVLFGTVGYSLGTAKRLEKHAKQE
ncbi:UAA transporter [Mycena floridula]|nr:UAA transporter [Mycena floridula]